MLKVADFPAAAAESEKGLAVPSGSCVFLKTIMPKRCSLCGAAKGNKQFTKTEWKRPDGEGVCRGCSGGGGGGGDAKASAGPVAQAATTPEAPMEGRLAAASVAANAAVQKVFVAEFAEAASLYQDALDALG